MSVINKKTFKVIVGGAEQEFAVLRPNAKITAKAQHVHARAFREAVDAGALVRTRIGQVMRDQKLWDDEKEKKFSDTSKRLLTNERKLAQGGIKLSEARELAMQMADDRSNVRLMLVDRNNLDQHTAESQAENTRFNFLVSACTVFADTGKPYFQDFDDYSSRENDPVADEAGANMAKLLYNLDDDHIKALPESKFLLKYKFVDEDLRLIDKDGKYVDSAGRRVNKKGQFVNDQGELIDSDGNLLTPEGDYKVDFIEFEDDLGVTASSAQTTMPTTEQAMQPEAAGSGEPQETAAV